MWWVLDHLDDLRSDFLVFYRIEDITQMPSRRFLAFAYRVGAYSGVVKAQLQLQTMRQEQGKSTTPGSTLPRPTVAPGQRSQLVRSIGEESQVEAPEESYLHQLLAEQKSSTN